MYIYRVSVGRDWRGGGVRREGTGCGQHYLQSHLGLGQVFGLRIGGGCVMLPFGGEVAAASLVLPAAGGDIYAAGPSGGTAGRCLVPGPAIQE